MKVFCAIPEDCQKIGNGQYIEENFARVALPEGLTDIEEGAFSRDCTTSFWVVKDSYAAYRISKLCPKSRILLFDSYDQLKESWAGFSKNKQLWNRVRSAMTEKGIYNIMRKSGWNYQEAVARAQRAYLEYGVTAEEYAAVKWKIWYKDDPERPVEGNWIQWRAKEIDKLVASLESGVMEYDRDCSHIVPMRIPACKYAASIDIGHQIHAGAIRLQTLCDFLDVELPRHLSDQKDRIIPSVAYYKNYVKPGCALFSWRKQEAFPNIAKKANVFVVFGPPVFKKDFEDAGLHYIVCQDLELKSFELASIWRKQFPETKTVCITGSVGKTTTTQMINNVALSSFKSNCIWVNKNLPLQCAQYTELLDEETGVYVQEASGAAVGQMERTTRVLEPDIFVVTNVGHGHIGLHGGNRMSLLYEKVTGDRRAAKDGLGVINYDDELLRNIPYQHEVQMFSIHDTRADFHAENIKEGNGILSFDVVEKDGTHTPVALHAIGLHNIYDALAAFITGLRLGLDRSVIAEALNAYRSQGVRQNLVDIAGRRYFLDCFSCTLDSVITVLNNAQSFEVKPGGKRILVIGDIPDLGNRSDEIHLEVGRLVHEAESIDQVIFFGYLTRESARLAMGGKPEVRYTNSRAELEKWLEEASRDDLVLFKSSHKMELHRVADDILGTTFNLDDLRSGIVARPVVKQVQYVNVKDYGSCAKGLTETCDKVEITSRAADMNVRLIDSKAFEGSDMEEIHMAEPMISIGMDAFSACRRLKKVALPDSIYYIGIGAFRDCSALEEIEIPAGCATIDSNAFAGCSSLMRVKLPASLLSIGEAAFDKNSKAVFECVKGSLAAEAIAAMCPEARILLRESDPEDVCRNVPDMSGFVFNDFVYTEESNIG